MGVHNSKVKGTGLMILGIFCRLFAAADLGRRYAVLGLIAIALTGTAIPPVAQQMVQSSFAYQPPVLMVFGDSLVAGHGLPQGEAFPDVLGQLLQNDGIDVRMVNAGVSGDTTAGGLARLDWSLADNPDAAIIVLGGGDCSPIGRMSRRTTLDFARGEFFQVGNTRF